MFNYYFMCIQNFINIKLLEMQLLERENEKDSKVKEIKKKII